MISEVKKGLYRHYKGNLYQVLGTGRHSETEEEYVIYQALYGKQDLWIRPKQMFLEKVLIAGQAVPRFELVEEGEANV